MVIVFFILEIQFGSFKNLLCHFNSLSNTSSFAHISGQSKHGKSILESCWYFLWSVISEGVLPPFVPAYLCVLLIVFEKVFLEVIIDLGKNLSIAFDRYLGSPLSKLKFSEKLCKGWFSLLLCYPSSGIQLLRFYSKAGD